MELLLKTTDQEFEVSIRFLQNICIKEYFTFLTVWKVLALSSGLTANFKSITNKAECMLIAHVKYAAEATVTN